jgi:hypothetical protein
VKSKWQCVGSWAEIISMEHSPATTRVYGSALIGRVGVVVAILRNAKVALLKLDDERFDVPEGALRWAVSWDDLDLLKPEGSFAAPVTVYVAGMSKGRGNPVLHAVLSGSNMAACSSPVRPLPFCEWSLPFSPGAPHACRQCVALVSGS